MDYVAPRTPVEELLANILSDVLGITRVGIHDSFFVLGGHSLLATQVVARVREVFSVDVPLRLLFERPTVAGLAEALVDAQAGASSPQRRPAGVAVPLSFTQQRLWFLDQLNPGGSIYNLPVALRLAGAIDLAAFDRSLQDLISRHETLRTTFQIVDGRPHQIVAPAAPNPLRLIDLRAAAPGERDAAVADAMRAAARAPFDLACGPLFRISIVRLGRENHLLLLTMHHSITDRWSMEIFVDELVGLYTRHTSGQPRDLPDLPIQYADYTLWQQQWLQGDRLEHELSYWKSRLAQAPTLELPLDHPRPPIQRFDGATSAQELSVTLTSELKALGQHEDSTLFMVLLTAFAMVLSRYSGQADLVVGTPIANRTHAEVERLIGFFANTLVLRVDLAGATTFRSALRRVREVCLGAYEHQHVPFELLVEHLAPTRDLSRHPLFQVMLILQNTPPATVQLPGLTIQPLPTDTSSAKFDLTLEARETADGLSCLWEYNTTLFDAATIARMQAHFLLVLEQVLAQPDAALAGLPLLTPPERKRLLADWNDTHAPFAGNACLYQLVAEQAARTPDAPAVHDATTTLTYAELTARAHQLAHALQYHGVGPDVLVALCLDRSCDLLVAVLAVLAAGGAYVPLDPTYPPERLAYMLADSQAPVLLTNKEMRDWRLESDAPQSPTLRLRSGQVSNLQSPTVIELIADRERIARQPETKPDSGVTPDHLAYVIYTSGSTGAPKGVQIVQRAVVNFLHSMQQRPGIAPGDVLLSVTTISFNIAVLELLLPLTVGASVVIVDRATAVDGGALAAALQDYGATLMQATPASWRLLLASGWTPPASLTILCGGEALPPDLISPLLPCRALWNMYGPTETTIWSTIAPITGDDGTAPIGHPIANTTLYVLDAHLRPVPIGVAGELYIGGAGLARGYLNRPELTAERFVPSPLSVVSGQLQRTMDNGPLTTDNRLYRTGDLVRWRPDGQLEYLGRLDQQVKVRGHRIELGEIEAVLGRYAGVQASAVTVWDDEGGNKRLVAYVVANQEQRTKNTEQKSTKEDSQFSILNSQFSGELRAFLQQHLPGSMVPSAFVVLDALPLTANGKINRRALPPPDQGRQAADAPFTAPRGPLEELLAAIWSNVLGTTHIGADDNFFELGGHSLLATQVIARVREVCRIDLPLRTLFEHPTIAGLAPVIAARRGGATSLMALPIQPAARNPDAGRGDQAPAASFAQERLWFLQHLDPASPAYNIGAAVRLIGPIDAATIERSLNALIERHEALRTTFSVVDGRPVQVIAPSATLSVPLIDLGELPETDREPAAQQLAQCEAQSLFDLAHGPLLRATVIRLAGQDHIVVLIVHHIVADGWSINRLISELTTTYVALAAGRPADLPELPIQYADYAAWQRRWLQGDALDRQLSYWKQQLASYPPQLELPTDQRRPALQTFDGATRAQELPPTLISQLKALGRREGSTLFMTLLAAFAALLSRYSGQDDLVVGTPVAGHNRAELENLNRGLYQHAAAARPARRRSQLPRAAGAGARGVSGGLRAPGYAVRAAGRAPGAHARPRSPPAVPGGADPPEHAAGDRATARPDHPAGLHRDGYRQVRPDAGGARDRRRPALPVGVQHHAVRRGDDRPHASAFSAGAGAGASPARRRAGRPAAAGPGRAPAARRRAEHPAPGEPARAAGGRRSAAEGGRATTGRHLAGGPGPRGRRRG